MEEEGRFAQENQCSKQNSDLQQVCQFNDLTSQLIKCGQILMHKTGKKRGQESIPETSTGMRMQTNSRALPHRTNRTTA